MAATDERTMKARTMIQPPAEWSLRRKILSAAVVLITVVAAGLFTWRASITPLRLWTNASQCAADPNGHVGSIFGLAISRDLRGASQITILDIETISWSGASAPTYWVVPVTDGSGGTGSASTASPPPHWNERAPAVGATLRADAPASLLVELRPRLGHALLNTLRVTYRTPDGMIHSASGDADMEVDTTGRCASSTGSLSR